MLELLAPAGSMDALRAAVQNGADAVYLGVGTFNARQSAKNFTVDSLQEALRYCHVRGVQVHLTLNTLVTDREIQPVRELIRAAAQAGVDAFIVQDLGVVQLCRQIAPQVSIHGSTQLTVHSLAGVQMCAAMGMDRVVLSRELNRQEIAYICANSPIEIEIFGHGALCMCYSGQCYLSAMIGSRSGNRGRCAQPCRQSYGYSRWENKYPLSLKDNCLVQYVKDIEAMGVASLKLEGRMKRPEYVAAVTQVYRQAIDGAPVTQEMMDTLYTAFNRQGFTAGYYQGKVDRKMFGIHEDTPEDQKFLQAARQSYESGEAPLVDLKFRAVVTVDGSSLTATDNEGHMCMAQGPMPERAVNMPLTGQALAARVAKTGGTPFTAEKITVEMDGGPWFIPGSAVNELRREALDALLKKREALRPWPTTEEHVAALPQRTLPPRRTLRARFERWEQVPERALDGVEYLILPIAQADRVPREWRAKTLLELPRVMFGALEQDTARRIAATQDAGFAGYEVSNIAHLRLCRGLPMTGGFGLNITNNVAAQFYAEQGLSSLLILPEVKDSDIATIAPTRNGKPVPTGVMIYGHMPLMLTRACPLQNIHDCAHCDKTGVLTDRKAKKFPVRCGLGVRTIYNPVPIYMGDKPGALAVDYGVAYFTLESREEAAQILDSIRTHAPFEGDFTRGLYFKGTN